ncbi:DNA-protecting protein DprA [Staphylococcus equorum subsp. linens]|uniref:DNA-processing protein DprA n=1 Tax=Staphylococcus equorum TaxID=246432 RepID=UPI000CD0CD67|nr:DNA-processing protein DprA [Staphylococcus equorum]MDK9842260.1 DNA-processing protein DprA [Staphylococcus equorum]PNZ08813.1 DNA-protecting protein DprA [Staphylococcus equorum subsp. linens]QQT18887.1 DNA-protecting protein DprA [Staphylococcus equorum]
MREHQYLKLRFSGLTTHQIHQLLRYNSNFLDYNQVEQNQLLKKFLSTLKTKRKIEIYEQYLNIEVKNILTMLRQWNLKYISIEQSSYPILLREIYEPPLILFYKGKISLMQSPQTLAIIGSRHATEYSQKALNLLFPSLKKENLTIISGLAKGADKMAHELALSMNMSAIAVLGFGHLQHYPKETFEIRKRLEIEGLVVSEYLPFQRPQKHHFPECNRIISGLSKGILITESKANSGTCITTNFALEQNREVYILPGSIFNPMTEGNLLSAQEGAKIVLKASDILIDYN